MSKNDFVLVHIRYGDKLDISHKAYYKNNKDNIFRAVRILNADLF